MRSGAARTPLIIAGIAALLTYAIAGHQTPFGFLHKIRSLHHHYALAKPGQGGNAAEAATETQDEAARDAAEDRDSRSESETRSLAPFDSIVIDDNAKATIAIGDTQSITVSSPDGRSDKIVTRVEDGKLRITGHAGEALVRVTVPHLHALQINGAGDVSLDGLRDPISIKTNGPVHLSASGAVDSADLILNGPSKLLFTKLETKNMTIQLNGIGEAEVFATQNLNAEVHGIGQVRYLGDPHTVSIIRGLGSVERLSVSRQG